jgi:uncharacterized protein
VPGSLRDNTAAYRFELELEGATAFIDYRRQGATLYLQHAEVPAALNGRGIGSRLVRETLDLVRARGERVVPVCSFIRAFVLRHGEYADLCVPD